MNIVVTGGAGFIGRRLVRQLLQQGTLLGLDGRPRTIERITIVDAVAADDLADPRLDHVVGDISDPSVVNNAITAHTSSIFHLAAVVSGMAEADFGLGMRINVDASRLILEACRHAGHRPRLVFASSVAVYGGAPSDRMRDDIAPAPRTSYGTQKAMVELLISDYSRRGFVDGRVLRLPTISVRPGRPERRGVFVRERHHPGAFERRARRVPGRSRDDAAAAVAVRRRRLPDPRSRFARRVV